MQRQPRQRRSRRPRGSRSRRRRSPDVRLRGPPSPDSLCRDPEGDDVFAWEPEPLPAPLAVDELELPLAHRPAAESAGTRPTRGGRDPSRCSRAAARRHPVTVRVGRPAPRSDPRARRAARWSASTSSGVSVSSPSRSSRSVIAARPRDEFVRAAKATRSSGMRRSSDWYPAAEPGCSTERRPARFRRNQPRPCSKPGPETSGHCRSARSNWDSAKRNRSQTEARSPPEGRRTRG